MSADHGVARSGGPAAQRGACLGGELQRLVDGWAARLQRSLAIDDMNLQLLAASAHYGDEDPARIRAVLGRGLDAATIDYLLASGVRSRQQPSWVPGVADLGLQTRLFVPVRCNGMTLGQLWLIDPDRSVDDETMALARTAAEEAGLVLYRRLVLREWEDRRNESILRDLFSIDVAYRERAMREIAEGDLLGAGDEVTVLALQPRDPANDPGRAGTAIAAAVAEATRAERPGTTLAMTSGRRATVLVAAGSGVARAASRLAEKVARDLASNGQRALVGIGSLVSGLDRAHVAAEQALTTVRAASLLPAMGDVVAWDDLGIYAVLMRLPQEDLISQVSTPAVALLTEHGDAADLANTAEVFLDCAGDTRQAATLLHVHRSTLYYRLERIEQITGLSLRDGGDRLVLHLGLKAHRLAEATRRQRGRERRP